jgi:hypothetical protein
MYTQKVEWRTQAPQNHWCSDLADLEHEQSIRSPPQNRHHGKSGKSRHQRHDNNRGSPLMFDATRNAHKSAGLGCDLNFNSTWGARRPKIQNNNSIELKRYRRHAGQGFKKSFEAPPRICTPKHPAVSTNAWAPKAGTQVVDLPRGKFMRTHLGSHKRAKEDKMWVVHFKSTKNGLVRTQKCPKPREADSRGDGHLLAAMPPDHDMDDGFDLDNRRSALRRSVKNEWLIKGVI